MNLPSPPPPDSTPWTTDPLHLDINGVQRVVQLPVPLGRRTLLDLLRPATVLAEALTSLAIEAAAQQKRCITCGPACGVCCRQLVGISVIEARALADVVAQIPEPRQSEIRNRFALGIRRLEEAGLLDPRAPKGHRLVLGPPSGTPADTARATARHYFELQIPCPFLEAESCSIYPHRAMMCREYHVSSPKDLCRHVHHADVRKIAPLMHMGLPLAETAMRIANLEIGTIPMILSLEWSAALGHTLDTPHDGQQLFQTWLSSLDAQWQTPFESRSA